MARFDVYTYGGPAPLVVDVQADIHADFENHVVIPLLPLVQGQSESMPKLKPLLRVNGAAYYAITTDLASIPASAFGKRIANLEDQRQLIIDAIDFLLQGF